MEPNHIGSLEENSLHASLKRWVAREGDLLEAPLDGYYIDIIQDGLLIEIQTGNFSLLKQKLSRLLENQPVRVVHPIPKVKWIVKESAPGQAQRRRSPRNGRVEDLFYELVRLVDLTGVEGFSLEILTTEEEEIQAPANASTRRASWRRLPFTCYNPARKTTSPQTAPISNPSQPNWRPKIRSCFAHAWCRKGV